MAPRVGRGARRALTAPAEGRYTAAGIGTSTVGCAGWGGWSSGRRPGRLIRRYGASILGRGGSMWTLIAAARAQDPVDAAPEDLEVDVEADLDADADAEGPRSWSRGFVPGVGWVATSRRADPDRWYAGPVADLDLVAFGHPDGSGPSHGRWYALVGLLPGDGDDVLVTYGTGLALSVEGAATRAAVLPEFGVEVLGTWRPGEGHVASLAPFGGFWLWNDPHVAVDVRCGYAYALERIDAWSGVRCGSSAHLALW